MKTVDLGAGPTGSGDLRQVSILEFPLLGPRGSGIFALDSWFTRFLGTRLGFPIFLESGHPFVFEPFSLPGHSWGPSGSFGLGALNLPVIGMLSFWDLGGFTRCLGLKGQFWTTGSFFVAGGYVGPFSDGAGQTWAGLP